VNSQQSTVVIEMSSLLTKRPDHQLFQKAYFQRPLLLVKTFLILDHFLSRKIQSLDPAKIKQLKTRSSKLTPALCRSLIMVNTRLKLLLLLNLLFHKKKEVLERRAHSFLTQSQWNLRLMNPSPLQFIHSLIRQRYSRMRSYV
jgi:hypothetical protein